MNLNRKVAKIFEEIAKIYDFLGENPFRIRAYEKAALKISSLSEDLEKYVQEDSLQKIPGIGKDLAGKIKEIYETGTLKQYEELKSKVPQDVLMMLNIAGLGPKKVKILYEKKNIRNIAELEKAAREGKLRNLPGFGAKTEENILKGIKFLHKSAGRIAIGTIYPTALALKKYLEEIPEIKKVDLVGSIRRFKETVHDIDILVVTSNAAKVMERFVSFPDVEDVISKGEKKSSVIISGVQVDLRVFDEKSYGAAMMYFTGSKEHNIRMRDFCLSKKLKLNEYGLYKNEKRVAGKTEEEVYKYLGMQFIPPEIREDLGEIELALKKRLPKLVELSDVKGDLHLHTSYSDGDSKIEDMIKAAMKRGYKYIAITDHSPSLTVAKGMTEEKINKQLEEIERLRRKYKEIKILTGIEVDILADGTLDLKDEILEKLDVVIAAIHTRFKMPKEEMTKRIIKAISHPAVNILAHPTGRLIGEREEYEIDIEEVLKTAAKNKVAIEINSYPMRLDFNAENCRKAKKLGVLFAINTDSHSTDQLSYIEFGVKTARRGWLEKNNIINTLPYNELMKVLKKE